jgi:serine/threonine protein kinase
MTSRLLVRQQQQHQRCRPSTRYMQRILRGEITTNTTTVITYSQRQQQQRYIGNHTSDVMKTRLGRSPSALSPSKYNFLTYQRLLQRQYQRQSRSLYTEATKQQEIPVYDSANTSLWMTALFATATCLTGSAIMYTSLEGPNQQQRQQQQQIHTATTTSTNSTDDIKHIPNETSYKKSFTGTTASTIRDMFHKQVVQATSSFAFTVTSNATIPSQSSTDTDIHVNHMDSSNANHPQHSSTTTTTRRDTDSGTTKLSTHMTSSSSSSSPRNVMIQNRRSLRGRSLHAKYRVDWNTVLGEGAYGTVYPGRLRATGEKVAIKKISRHYTTTNTFQAETDGLQRIYDNGGHPNISGLRDMYEDSTHYYLILDLVTGGEMFEHLIQYGAYSEADAARLVHEIASALAFIHGVGVVHADLKPENLLLSTKNRLDGTIKMIDFGCAVVSDDNDLLLDDDDDADNDTNSGTCRNNNSTMKKKKTIKTVRTSNTPSSIGTTAYWPPERFSMNDGERSKHDFNITPAMDMWSVGVILYIMLTGVHPFDVRGISTDIEIERTIRANPKPPLDKELVGHLSDSVIDLILKLMEPDPNKRITAYQMLQHPWARGETALTERIPDSDKKLSKFKDVRANLEAGMFSVLVSQGHSDVRLSEAKVGKKHHGRRNASSNGKSQSVTGSSSSDDEMDDYEEDVNDDDTDSRRQNDGTAHIMQRAFAFFDATGKGFVTSDDLERVANERTSTKVSSNDTKEYVQTTAESTANMLSLSQFNKLFSGMRHKHYPRGHYIFHAGEKGDAMYFLSSGKVEIQTRKGQLVAILRSGDFFGEGSLLNEETLRFTSAKCSTPVDVIEIKRTDFDRYMGVSEKARHELKLKWRARSLTYAKNLLRLQENVKARDFKKGDIIYREGDLSTSMYRVDDEQGGELEVSHGNNVVHRYTAGDSFGESSLLFKRPRSSTVTCTSDTCRLYEMKGEDFFAVIEASPEMASALRNMCRKRLFKKAVKAYSLQKKGGLTDDDIVAAFYDADIDGTGALNLEEVRRIFHQMEPEYPMSEIKALLEFVDVDEDGQITLEEFKRLFRQFEDEKV